MKRRSEKKPIRISIANLKKFELLKYSYFFINKLCGSGNNWRQWSSSTWFQLHQTVIHDIGRSKAIIIIIIIAIIVINAALLVCFVRCRRAPMESFSLTQRIVSTSNCNS